MKTIVYVDGYNIFYGLLKHSPYKWLDLFTLFDTYILRAQDPTTELLTVKYFTADIKARFASHGQDAISAQSSYHRALESPKTGSVEIIKGSYSAAKNTPMLYAEPPDKNKRVETWKLEEKQTDVNLALSAYRDAAKGNCQQIVICSNDSDIYPVFRMIREDYPSIRLGMVAPLAFRQVESERKIPKKESIGIDWLRGHITADELMRSQFPDRVPTNKKPAIKPSYW